MVAPSLDVSIRFLVEVADGTRRYSGSPECLGDILNTAYGNASQVHFDESFFDAALAASVALDDGCFEGDTFQFRYFQRDIAGSRL